MDLAEADSIMVTHARDGNGYALQYTASVATKAIGLQFPAHL